MYMRCWYGKEQHAGRGVAVPKEESHRTGVLLHDESCEAVNRMDPDTGIIWGTMPLYRQKMSRIEHRADGMGQL